MIDALPDAGGRCAQGLTRLAQAHEGKVGAMGGRWTLGLMRPLLFDLRVMMDTFEIIVKGEGL